MWPGDFFTQEEIKALGKDADKVWNRDRAAIDL